MPRPPYTEHKGYVIARDDRFKHSMALTLDPSSRNRRGIVRCITSRTGDVKKKGYVDRSELHLIEGDSLEHFTIGDKLVMHNEDDLCAFHCPFFTPD